MIFIDYDNLTCDDYISPTQHCGLLLFRGNFGVIRQFRQASMYYSVYYIKVTPKIAPEIALKHNAESAIIVKCEIIINHSHVRLSFLSVAESSIKHYILYII